MHRIKKFAVKWMTAEETIALLRLRVLQLEDELRRNCAETEKLLQSRRNASGEQLSADFRERKQLDLSCEFDGLNWHQPEINGTWAGIDLLSKIYLNNVRVGRYILVLDVSDAMNQNILNSLRLFVASQELRWSIDLSTGNSALLTTEAFLAENFSVTASEEVRIVVAIQASEAVSPADSGSEDTRRLSFKLRSLTLIPT